MDGVGPSGETIMDYTIYDAIQAGFGKIVFVIRKQMEKAFNESILRRMSPHIEVECVFQELDHLPEGCTVPDGREKPWGTGHALWVAHSAVSTPFAMVNADDFYGRDALRVMANHLSTVDQKEASGCLVGFVLENTLSEYGSVSRRVCEVNQGNLVSIQERTHIAREKDGVYYKQGEEAFPLKETELVSMNLMGFTPPVFDVMEEGFRSFYEKNNHNLTAEFYIPDVLKALVHQGNQVPVLPTSSRWFGVTYKEDKPAVQSQIARLVDDGMYPSKLWRR